MHVVVIHRWREESPEFVQSLATALGVTGYEVKQRLIGGGPSVVASFADRHQAVALAAKLVSGGAPALVVDVDSVRSGVGRAVARRFELGRNALKVETVEGDCAEVAYGDIELLMTGTRIAGQTETKTVTERKFSLGGTILSGGIPVSKKVERQEVVSTEERTRLLYLVAGERPLMVFRQSGMSYDGLGAEMKMSQELNFSHLIGELRRLCPDAVYDERLATRVGQVRLLGPAQNPETNLDLAAEILAQSLRCRT